MATLFPAPASLRRPGRAFDLGIAGFAAAAVAFVCFAMPADLLGSLIGRTPLPSLVPAAAPPLGATARLLLMVGAAGLTFTALVFALGALSQPVKPRPTALDVPRLRRADAHPDAPARRPILAKLDLGDPLELDGEAAPEAPLPARGEEVPEFLNRVEADDACEVDNVDTCDAENAQRPASAEVPPSLPPLGRESLAELIQRLEQGLARHGAATSVPVPPPLQHYEPRPLAAEPSPTRVDPLGEALAELERMAARR